MRNHIFISYSHKDKVWLERLQTMLRPLVRDQTITIWDDTRIKAGAEWREEIKRALEGASVAVLLVSPDFLASDFIAEHELPPLLKAAQQEGLTILWVPVRPSLYRETEIARYQAAHNPKRPLSPLKRADQEKALVQICEQIISAVHTSTERRGRGSSENHDAGRDDQPTSSTMPIPADEHSQHTVLPANVDHATPPAPRRLRVFLCHSSADKPAVRKLYQRLTADDIDAWLDEKKLIPGHDWQREIADAVRMTDLFIVCLSQRSATEVGFIQKEITYALDIAEQQPEGRIFIIPVKLEECDVPERLRQWQWVNLLEEDGYKRLSLAFQVSIDEINKHESSAGHEAVKTVLSQIETLDRSQSPSQQTAEHTPVQRPTDFLITDASTIIDSHAKDIEQVFGTPATTTAGLIGASEGIPDEGEMRTYHIGTYTINVMFDKTGIAKEVHVSDGLSALAYALDQWPVVLSKLGIAVTKTPDAAAPAELTWNNYIGYAIIVAANEPDGNIQSVRIRKLPILDNRSQIVGEESKRQSDNALQEDVRRQQLATCYEQAIQSLNDEDWEKALIQLQNIQEQEPGYEGTEELLKLVKLHLMHLTSIAERRQQEAKEQAHLQEEVQLQQDMAEQKHQLSGQHEHKAVAQPSIQAAGVSALEEDHQTIQQPTNEPPQSPKKQLEYSPTSIPLTPLLLNPNQTSHSRTSRQREAQQKLAPKAYKFPNLLRQIIFAVVIIGIPLSLWLIQRRYDIPRSPSSTTKQETPIAGAPIISVTASPISSPSPTADVASWSTQLVSDTAPVISAATSTQLRELSQITIYRDDKTRKFPWAIWSPDGKFIAILSRQGILIYDAQSLLNVNIIETTADTHDIAFVPNSHILAVASTDGVIRLWRVSDGVLLDSLPAPKTESIAFSSDGRLLASATGSVVIVWQINNGEGKYLQDIYSTSSIWKVIFSPNSKLLATMSSSRFAFGGDNINIWQISNEKTLHHLDMGVKYITDFEFTPNGEIVVTASDDKTIKLWKVDNSSILQTLIGHTERINDVTFSPDGEILATASDDKTIRLWLTKDGSMLHLLEGHTEPIHSVAFSPDGKFLLAASKYNTVRLWGIGPENKK